MWIRNQFFVNNSQTKRTLRENYSDNKRSWTYLPQKESYLDFFRNHAYKRRYSAMKSGKLLRVKNAIDVV